MNILELGCCGAYCKTCKAFRGGICRGCKLGYENGERNIARSKCKMKLCCFKEKKLQTCADCNDFGSCAVIQHWYLKTGPKYQRYKEALEYIQIKGYNDFLKIAEDWKDASGKLPTTAYSGSQKTHAR